MNEPNPTLPIGFCSFCGSSNLDALPPNSFSRKPGYVCTECGTKHREAKSTWQYLGILLLGLAMAGGGIAVFFSDNRPDTVAPRKGPLPLVFIGIAVAGWAAWQLRMPKVSSQQKH